MARLSSGNALACALQKLTLLGRPSTETGTWTLDLSAAVIIFNCGPEPSAFKSGRETTRLNRANPVIGTIREGALKPVSAKWATFLPG